MGSGCSHPPDVCPYATPGLACNGSFDMYVCWDYAAPNTTARASCPWYLPWHRDGEVPPGLWCPRHHFPQTHLHPRSCSSPSSWVSPLSVQPRLGHPDPGPTT